MEILSEYVFYDLLDLCSIVFRSFKKKIVFFFFHSSSSSAPGDSALNYDNIGSTITRTYIIILYIYDARFVFSNRYRSTAGELRGEKNPIQLKCDRVNI